MIHAAKVVLMTGLLLYGYAFVAAARRDTGSPPASQPVAVVVAAPTAIP
jgi:hypothetical protein